MIEWSLGNVASNQKSNTLKGSKQYVNFYWIHNFKKNHSGNFWDRSCRTWMTINFSSLIIHKLNMILALSSFKVSLTSIKNSSDLVTSWWSYVISSQDTFLYCTIGRSALRWKRRLLATFMLPLRVISMIMLAKRQPATGAIGAIVSVYVMKMSSVE